MSQKLSYAQSTDEALPDGWFWSTLGEVADVLAGNPAPQGDEFFADGRYPFVRVQDMGRLNGVTKINTTNDYINDKAAKGLRLFPKGSVLFTKSGASTLLNQRAMLGSDMYVVSHIAAAIPKDGVLSEWLYYWLRTVDFAYLAHATTLPSLPLSKAKAIPVPVATLDQQKRIVAEIEKQFSRLDEAVANLKRVKTNLKRYKAAVLKAAVEGRLVETEAELARKEGRSYESGEKLLQRILETRRSQWQGKGKYKEPAAPDTTVLPELPEGWVWVTLDSLIVDGPQNGLYLPKSLYGSGHPILRIDDYQQDWIRPVAELQRVRAKAEDIATYSLRSGDLVINRVNSPSHLGKVAIWAAGSEMPIFESNMMRAALSSAVVPIYIANYLRSVDGRAQLIKQAKWAVNQASINQQDVCGTPVPLPPLAEQYRIVLDIERRLSISQEVDAQIEIDLRRGLRLRQAVLADCFSPNGEGSPF